MALRSFFHIHYSWCWGRENKSLNLSFLLRNNILFLTVKYSSNAGCWRDACFPYACWLVSVKLLRIFCTTIYNWTATRTIFSSCSEFCVQVFIIKLLHIFSKVAQKLIQLQEFIIEPCHTHYFSIVAPNLFYVQVFIIELHTVQCTRTIFQVAQISSAGIYNRSAFLSCEDVSNTAVAQNSVWRHTATASLRVWACRCHGMPCLATILWPIKICHRSLWLRLLPEINSHWFLSILLTRFKILLTLLELKKNVNGSIMNKVRLIQRIRDRGNRRNGVQELIIGIIHSYIVLLWFTVDCVHYTPEIITQIICWNAYTARE